MFEGSSIYDSITLGGQCTRIPLLASTVVYNPPPPALEPIYCDYCQNKSIFYSPPLIIHCHKALRIIVDIWSVQVISPKFVLTLPYLDIMDDPLLINDNDALKISAADNWGPRSRVSASSTLCWPTINTSGSF